MSDKAGLAPYPEIAPLRILMLLGGGVMLAGAGLSMPSGLPMQTGAWVAGLALCFVAIWFGARAVWRRRRGQTALETARNLVDADLAMVFVVASDGTVVHRNASAQLLGDVDVSRALADLIASPDAVVERLDSAARRSGTQSEDIMTRRGLVRVTATRLDGGLLAWRVDLHESDQGAGGDALRLPMMTVSRTGKILFLNNAFRQLLGGRPTDLEQVFASLPIESGQVHRVNAAGGPIDTVVVEITGSGGRSEIYLLPGVDGVQARSGAGWDMVEDLPVPLLKVGLGGEILGSNREARDLLRSDIRAGTQLSDLLDGLGRPMDDWLREAHRAPGRIETQFLKGAGSRKNLFVQVALCHSRGGEIPHMIAVLHNATEFKSLEEQFVQSQKMQAIGQLAGGVAHDFNNLLTAISGHADLLLLRHQDGDPDFGDLNQIRQNTNRAAALVRQLLAFSRKQDLKLVSLDLRTTLADLTHLLNRLVGERVSLTLKHDPAPLLVKADKRQFEQVIMNLVVNARDAMLDGGSVRIEAENLTLDEPFTRDRATLQAGDYVVIRVVDDGHGIPPEIISHIFEPFYTTKGVGEGTGLGLSTAYGIVKQLSGFIFVDSKEGEGAVFSVYLPAMEESAIAQTATAAPPELEEVTAATILLVEDEVSVRAFASRALKMRGYTVIEADCGEQALEILSDSELYVDLFLTDVIMPGLDGPTWVKEALAARPNTSVVFMSGYSEESMRETRAQIPNSDFLPKPFSLVDLASTVQAQIKPQKDKGGGD